MTEPRRDRYGRYIIPDPTTGEDREWTRATTIAGVLPDRFNLERWGERMVAYGIAQREDLIALAQSVTDPKDEKRTLDKIARDAKQAAQAGSRANLGTALHKFTEMVDKGESPKIPFLYKRDIIAYQTKMRELGIKVVDLEQIVVNPEIGVAGTFDRTVTVPGFELPVILDLKTGATVDFSQLEHAVQLAIYAHAPYRFDTATGAVTPALECEKTSALIVHLPAGEGVCEVHELDITRGWKLAQIAAEVYVARKDRTLSKKFEPREGGEVDAVHTD